jgi:integral membrane protein (TIGR01906 family)
MFLRSLLVIALPLVLVLINAGILMSNLFLQWEYNRPGFPADPFGFTTQDRLHYAPLAMAYLFNSEGIEFLSKQTFPDGSPLYSEQALSHMSDVKGVTRNLSLFGYVLIAGVLVSIFLLARQPDLRPALLKTLRLGGIVTIALILVGLLITAVSFRELFTAFHRLFFQGDSWLFPYSDTLIRLFPIEFWTDAFALMFGGALIGGGLIAGISTWLLRRKP